MMRWGHSLRVVAPNGISGRFFPGTSFPQLSAPPREILLFSSKVAVIHAGALMGGIFPE